MAQKEKKSQRPARRPENPFHSPKKELTPYQQRMKEDYTALRSGAFKQAAVNPSNSVVYFDRPGDQVEGYLVGLMPASAVSAAHFIVENQGTQFEIKAHQLLRQIIQQHNLLGEYVRIVYRGRVKSSFYAKAAKSYYVYTGKSKRQLELVQAGYPDLAESQQLQGNNQH